MNTYRRSIIFSIEAQKYFSFILLLQGSFHIFPPTSLFFTHCMLQVPPCECPLRKWHDFFSLEKCFLFKKRIHLCSALAEGGLSVILGVFDYVVISAKRTCRLRALLKWILANFTSRTTVNCIFRRGNQALLRIHAFDWHKYYSIEKIHN